MRHATVIAALVCLVAAIAGNSQQPGPLSKAVSDQRDRVVAEAKDAAKALIKELGDAKVLASAISDATLRVRMADSLSRAEKQTDRLQKALVDLGGTVVLSPLTAEEYTKLMASLRAEAFDDKRLPLLKDVVRHKGFTCQQAAAIVKAFNFSKGQQEAAVMMHPRLTDPVNFHEVLRAMTFESDRNEVRKRLGLGR